MKDNPFIGFTPFPNQRNNIIQLINKRKAILSDHVGSGKTMSTIGAYGTLWMREQLRWLIVFMPKNAYDKRVWQKDIEQFTTLRVKSLDEIKTLDDINACDILLCKHTHVKSDMGELLATIAKDEHVLVAIDEAHAFKNPDSDLSKCMKYILKESKNTWFITGTTLSRNVEDTYHLLNLLYPGILGNFYQFRSTYCKTKEKVTGRKPDGSLKKVLEIVGIKDEQLFKSKISPYMITGESFVYPKFKYLDYTLTQSESDLYTKISSGIDVAPDCEGDEWVQQVLSNPTSGSKYIKSVESFSNRFIYLQSCADGTLTDKGVIENHYSSKIHLFMQTLQSIIDKGQSCIVYFDYLATLNIIKDDLVATYGDKIALWESSGSVNLKPGCVTEEGCREKPNIILGTRASSESVSYYFINNVIFFHTPTVPHTAVQLVGRITRKNTLFPNDLNVYFFRSMNIDLYKLIMVSYKTYQMEQIQGKECNIPEDYKTNEPDVLEKAKKALLWRK